MVIDMRRVSKHMAYLLRHNPAAGGLDVDEGGWVDLDQLIEGLRSTYPNITHDDVLRIVTTNAKRRYQLADNRVRAAQGHSFPVTLGLEPSIPPSKLFHGTVERFVKSIEHHGLRPQSRNHVHLSDTADTARQVGARRGTPVLFTIDTASMTASGQLFYQSANGVWLTDRVEPTFLHRIQS